MDLMGSILLTSSCPRQLITLLASGLGAGKVQLLMETLLKVFQPFLLEQILLELA